MSETTAPMPLPTLEARTVNAERGLGWWTDAWAMFVRHPGPWLVMGLLLLVGFFVLGVIPFIGGLAVALLWPVLVGGWLLAARKSADGGTPEIADLFACFRSDRMTPLLTLGALLLAFTVVLMLVAGVLGLGAVFGAAAGGARHSMGGMMGAAGVGLFAFLLLFVLGALATMALWFAPALVVFRQTAPVAALKASFAATMKNVVVFLVFGLIYIVASIVASIPLMLGWLVLVPVSLLAAWVSYRDVFGE